MTTLGNPNLIDRPQGVPQARELLRVGGLSRLSSVDWPGHLVATVFCQGCPWRCPYCHNPHLLGARGETEVRWADVHAFLLGRRGLLDGVVFTGGEPLLQPGLSEAIEAVRDMGYQIGLHTGGVRPDRLKDILTLVDWVGFDMKAPFAEYERITGAADSGDLARESLTAVIESGVPYQVRTTVHPKLLDSDALNRLRLDLVAMGATETVIQPFRPDGCITTDLI